MRLLLITQKVDRNDPVLAFVHGWLEEFSRHFEKISVICLQKGNHNLPPNVEVYSLGKEEGNSRSKYVWRFFKYIFMLRKNYGAVFVHMNQEYVILGGLFWRLWGKKVVLWYNHTQRGFRLRLAMLLANEVWHTSPYSASAGSHKSRKMPVGIDTAVFVPGDAMRRPGSILSLGRLAPIKHIEVIVRAIKELSKAGAQVQLTIVGEALPKDREYAKRLQDSVRDSAFSSRIRFQPAESDREKVAALFNSHQFFINASPAGLFDKAVFEAIACGCVPVVSSTAFKEILPPECFFEEGNSASLSAGLRVLLSLSTDQLEVLRKDLREKVVSEHSLTMLASRMESVLVPR